jgi:hypothetical protein
MKRIFAAITIFSAAAVSGPAVATTAGVNDSAAVGASAETRLSAVSSPAGSGASSSDREVIVPAGTILRVELATPVGSDSSRLEDPVRATLRRPVTIAGVRALPAGTALAGHVTAAERSARVKGRARIAFRFTTIDPPGDSERLAIRTRTVSRLAPATKRQDAAKIGGGAAGGAIVGGILGGILGGGDGAAKGAAIGGAAGTGVVLSTRGREIRLGRGALLSVRLTAPLTVRVRED